MPPSPAESARRRQVPAASGGKAAVRVGEADLRSAGRRDRDREKGPEPKIEELLKEGQEIIVQVAKEPLGTKGARLTSHATMPGRFLVFMPTVDHVGVSRKIDSRDERSRLRGIVREFREQHGFTGGVIIRTAAAGRPKEDIVSDLSYFHRVWTDIRQKAETSRAPAVVYQEQSLVAKLLRDLLTEEFSAIRIDNELEYRRVLELIERIMPSLAPKVKLYEKEYPDLRGVRRPGGDRQGAAQQGLAEVGRLDRHQPDRGARRDRRQHRPLRRQEDRRPPRGHHPQDQPRGGEGDRPADPAARPRRHHRARLHRHGGEEEPAEGLPDGRAGAAQGPRAVEGAAGVGLRAGHHHAQAREAEPRARAHRAVPVLRRQRGDQVELDDLLRDPVRGEEDQRRPRTARAWCCA